jgi:hypothetical protein
MYRKTRAILRAMAVVLLAGGALNATLVPQLSFEQLTDASEMVVAGTVSRSWGAWDADHKYIWTHYELAVDSALKGSPGATVEFAEPGGSANGSTMAIAGSVLYAAGDRVTVFLARMPNGYLRTSGWAQGKYVLDSEGRLHSSAMAGAELAVPQTARGTSVAAGATPVRMLDGMSLSSLRAMVTARVRATGRAK